MHEMKAKWNKKRRIKEKGREENENSDSKKEG